MSLCVMRKTNGFGMSFVRCAKEAKWRARDKNTGIIYLLCDDCSQDRVWAANSSIEPGIPASYVATLREACAVHGAEARLRATNAPSALSPTGATGADATTAEGQQQRRNKGRKEA